ncbi:WhiB family transcriptional regulator [Kitasatospora sp. NPDC002522]
MQASSVLAVRRITPARHQPGELLPEPEWVPDAACRYVDPELFFPSQHSSAVQQRGLAAKRVCNACPVREPCLAAALVNREPQGIWGGLTTRERHRLFVEARRLQTLGQAEASALLAGRPAEVRLIAMPSVAYRLADAGWDEEAIAVALKLTAAAAAVHLRTARTAAPYRHLAVARSEQAA